MSPDLDALRAKVAALRGLDLDNLRARVQLLAARVDLDAIADAIAADTDSDADVVLLVVQAAWFAHIDLDLDAAGEIDADAFRDRVEASVRCVLAALAEGVTEVGDPVVDEALRRAIELGKQGIKITPTRERIDEAMTLISTELPG